MLSCSTSSKSLNINISFKKIIIGDGGGSIGLISGYSINFDGKIFLWNGKQIEENLTELNKLPSDSLIYINNIIETNKLIELKYQNPHNFYSFIKIITNNSENYIVWDPYSKDEMAKSLNDIKNNIISIINNNK